MGKFATRLAETMAREAFARWVEKELARLDAELQAEQEERGPAKMRERFGPVAAAESDKLMARLRGRACES
jgi:hypothetical protein